MLAISPASRAVITSPRSRAAATLPALKSADTRKKVVVRFKEDGPRIQADVQLSPGQKATLAGAAGMAIEQPRRELTQAPVVGPTTSTLYSALSWITLGAAVAATCFPASFAEHLGLVHNNAIRMLMVAAGATLIPISQGLRSLMVATDLQLTDTHTSNQLCGMAVVWGLTQAWNLFSHSGDLGASTFSTGVWAAIAGITAVIGAITAHRFDTIAQGVGSAVAGPQIVGIIRGVLSGVRVLFTGVGSFFTPTNRASLVYSLQGLFAMVVGAMLAFDWGQNALIGSYWRNIAPGWLGSLGLAGTAGSIALNMLISGLYASAIISVALKHLADRGMETRPIPGGLNASLGISQVILATVTGVAMRRDLIPTTGTTWIVFAGFLASGLYSMYKWLQSPTHVLGYDPALQQRTRAY